MTVSLTVAELEQARDLDLGASDWFEIDQERIDTFADATGDHQWIHVDPERAAEGPFGKTVAHGYLTLSLMPHLLDGLLTVTDVRMGINYGIDNLRLTAPVPVGSRVRVRASIANAESKAGGVLYRVATTVEIEGHDKPALVGTLLYLLYS